MMAPFDWNRRAAPLRDHVLEVVGDPGGRYRARLATARGQPANAPSPDQSVEAGGLWWCQVMTTVVADSARTAAGNAAHQCRQVSPNPPERLATARIKNPSDAKVAATETVRIVGLMCCQARGAPSQSLDRPTPTSNRQRTLALGDCYLT